MDVTLSDPLTGRLLGGRYEVGRRIAHGGMATVFDGQDRRLGRRVAIKVMHPNYAADPAFVARFIREARSAAHLPHPNVVAVYDQGTDGGTTYLVMEYVDGVTLRQVLRQRGRLEPDDALQVLEQVLDALAAAHRAGIVHRDVKPENIILTTDGRVKVADFGLARAMDDSAASTMTGSVILGTVAYLAPEIVERGRPDARTDVYAAGIVLFEMITGTKPFSGDSPIHVAFRHVNERVPAPSSVHAGVGEPVDTLVIASTARRPDNRFPDARAFRDAVRAVRRGEDPVLPEPAAPDINAAAATGPTTALETTRTFRDDGQHSAEHDTGVAAGTTRLDDGHLDPLDRPGIEAERADGYAATARRRRRRGWIVVLVTILIGALLAVGTYWWTVGRYTTTPGVVDKSQSAAENLLTDAGLQPRIAAGFSETVAAGTVIDSEPAPGERVLDGGTVTLTVSKGKERYAVPPVVGKSVAAASAMIETLPLKVAPQTVGEWNDDLDPGLVIRTMPPVGDRVAKRDAIVTLYVSKGPQPVDVPTVVGKSLDEAQQLLAAANLTETHDEQAYSDTVPEGAVISQSPQNTSVDPGTTVELVISKGPELFAVPDVEGKDTDEAIAIIRDHGFVPNVVNWSELPEFLRNNLVIRQNPGSDEMLPHGATVTIYVI